MAIAFARLTRYAYRLNLLDARQILASKFTDALRVKESEKETRREEKINAPLGERDATRWGRSDKKKKEIKNACDDGIVGHGVTKTVRNILQRKPINKGRLDRGIKHIHHDTGCASPRARTF